MIQKPQTIYERPDERDALRARVAELEAALSTWKADHAATKGELFRVLPEHLRYREALEHAETALLRISCGQIHHADIADYASSSADYLHIILHPEKP